MRAYLHRHWLALALVCTLVIGGAFSYADSRARQSREASLTRQLTENTVQGCLRTRTFKLEMIGFLDDAGEARAASARTESDPAQKKIDQHAADRYAARASRIRASLVNCEAAYSPVP